MSSNIEDADYWLERAREAHEQAEQVRTSAPKRTLLEIAAGYQRVALQVEERTGRRRKR